MNSITLEELQDNMTIYLNQAQSGALFIYPTDTIYGIGAIINPETVQRIDAAKQRLSGKHYSIIAPSFDRIQDKFNVSKNIEDERTKRQNDYPGRGLTILLSYKNSSEYNFNLLSSTSNIGVRYLGNHPFQQFITALGKPFITSSCNISGAVSIQNIKDIPEILKKQIDIIVDGGILDGKASVVIDYETRELIRK